MKDITKILMIIVLAIGLNLFHFLEIKADSLKTEKYKKAEKNLYTNNKIFNNTDKKDI
jgi:hypothetical protein